jgi:hypothetical protein
MCSRRRSLKHLCYRSTRPHPLRLNNFATNIRELSRIMLHRLAPDQQVRACTWYVPVQGKISANSVMSVCRVSWNRPGFGTSIDVLMADRGGVSWNATDAGRPAFPVTLGVLCIEKSPVLEIVCPRKINNNPTPLTAMECDSLTASASHTGHGTDSRYRSIN